VAFAPVIASQQQLYMSKRKKMVWRYIHVAPRRFTNLWFTAKSIRVPWRVLGTLRGDTHKKMISIESVAGFDRDDYDTWLVFMFYIMFLLLSSLSSSKLPYVRYIDCWFSKILIVNPPQSFGLSRKERLRQRQHRIFVSLLWSVAR
jgi:hypothetical protein